MRNDLAKDDTKTKADSPRRSLRRAVFGLERQVEQEQEHIARSNRRKSLLVVALFVIVLAALLIAYLQPA